MLTTCPACWPPASVFRRMVADFLDYETRQVSGSTTQSGCRHAEA